MPQVEERKIIRVGNSLAVTIPRGWLRYFGLKPQDIVVIETNGELVVKPKNMSGEKNE